jgi:hypothetical protein
MWRGESEHCGGITSSRASGRKLRLSVRSSGRSCALRCDRPAGASTHHDGQDLVWGKRSLEETALKLRQLAMITKCRLIFVDASRRFESN